MATKLPELAVILSIITLGQRFSGYENRPLGYLLAVIGIIAGIAWIYSVIGHLSAKESVPKEHAGKLRVSATWVTALIFAGFVAYPWLFNKPSAIPPEQHQAKVENPPPVIPPVKPSPSPYADYRFLTPEQYADIKAALDRFNAGTIGIYTYDGSKEQTSYTEELSEAFHRSGWTILRGKPFNKADAAWLGLDSGPLKHSGVSVIAIDEVSPEPAVAALAAAKIPHQVVRDLKNQVSAFYNSGIEKSMLVLFVGPKDEPE